MKNLITFILITIGITCFSQVRYTGGNLGVGTTSPSSSLNIHGSSANIEISNPIETESGILFYDHGYESTQYAKIMFDCAGSNALNFYFKGTLPTMSLTGTAVNMETGNVNFGDYFYTTGDQIKLNYVSSSSLGESSKPWFTGYFKYLYRTYEYSLSDKKIKKNIEPITSAIEIVNKLNPVTYGIKDHPTQFKEAKSKAGEIHYGFIAQEVQEILPDLTSYSEETDLLYLDYEGIIPILTRAFQELKFEVDSLKEIINSSTSKLESSNARLIENQVNTIDIPSKLYQNIPNPFSENTEIRFDISIESLNAQLFFFDLNGSMIQSHQIKERGNSKFTLDRNSLSPGIYLYSLIVDGNEVGTYRMILTD